MFLCKFESCGKAFKKPSLLELHENMHLGKRTFICKECGKGYFKNSHLKVHFLRMHTKAERKVCNDCGKMLASEEGLKKHKEVCGRAFMCEVCHIKFVRAKWYLRHMRECAGVATKSLEEEKDSESADRKSSTKEKAKSRLSGRIKEVKKDLYRCQTCYKGFRLKNNCAYHEKHSHSATNMYVCGRCSKTYRHKGSLTRHIFKAHKENVKYIEDIGKDLE